MKRWWIKIKGWGIRIKGWWIRIKGWGIRIKGWGIKIKGWGIRIKRWGIKIKGWGECCGTTIWGNTDRYMRFLIFIILTRKVFFIMLGWSFCWWNNKASAGLSVYRWAWRRSDILNSYIDTAIIIIIAFLSMSSWMEARSKNSKWELFRKSIYLYIPVYISESCLGKAELNINSWF